MKLRNVALLVGLWAVAVGSAQAAGGADAGVQIAVLAKAWAHLNYEIPDKRQEAAEAGRLAAQADSVAKRSPARAEPLLFEALIVLSEADARHDIGSLALVKTARHLLERAAKLGPPAPVQATIYANLGSLYAQLPGFPLSFGDPNKARVYLEKAMAASPDGLDANYFYGDFLFRQGDYAKAVGVLEHALSAPGRPGMELADRGRKGEAAELLEKAHKKLSESGGGHPAPSRHKRR